jgi:hypothetical protein
MWAGMLSGDTDVQGVVLRIMPFSTSGFFFSS